MALIETINLIEKIQERDFNLYNDSAQTLFDLIQISRWSPIVHTAERYLGERLREQFPELDFSDDSRVSKAYADTVWKLMSQPNGKKSIDDRFRRVWGSLKAYVCLYRGFGK